MKEDSTRNLTIGIQGWEGSFHQIAAEMFFKKNISILPCETFNDLFISLKEGKSDAIVMAIENSVAGSIRENFVLLKESNFPVCGEVYLRIEQNLMALPNQGIGEIREVHSHPMAIAQCRNFFSKYPDIALVESVDTALAAKQISELKQKGVGTVASTKAAEIFGLNILKRSIENDPINFTRFLIIQKTKAEDIEVNKASICFTLPHSIGALAKVLTISAFHNINLTKIESLPVIGKKWSYEFYIDLIFDNITSYFNFIDAVRPFTEELRILGEYQEGSEYLPEDFSIEHNLSPEKTKSTSLCL